MNRCKGVTASCDQQVSRENATRIIGKPHYILTCPELVAGHLLLWIVAPTFTLTTVMIAIAVIIDIQESIVSNLQ